jgi:hypothetical protein
MGSPLPPQAQAALDAVRRLPAAERTAVVLALAAELLGGGDSPPIAQDAPGGTIPPAGGPRGNWSRPNKVVAWAEVFRCSANTMRRWFRDGTIRGKRVASRWAVHVDDLPTGRQ